MDQDFDVESIAHLLDADTTSHEQNPANDLPAGFSQYDPSILSLIGGDLSKNDDTKGFNMSLGETWMYPINYPLREYQYKISQEALFKNTLVCLPTGLGKTFIAAVVIYNMYRWYPQGKIVFMAPTKPLVTQQISACMTIATIPKEDIIEITGKLSVESRQEFWNLKRVFFITPQTLQNDLSMGYFPTSLLRLLVIDEAHHTRGKYSYGEVVRAIREKHTTFRVMALTATPGKNVEDVIEIINCLQINQLEIRSDDSDDVKPYIHTKNIQIVVIKLDPMLTKIREKYINIIDTYVRRLLELRVLSGSMGTLHKGRIIMEYKQYRASVGKRHPQHAQIMSDFTMCVSLYHGLELLVSHGYRVFLKYFEDTSEKGWLFKELRLQHLIKEVRDEVGSFDLNATMPDGSVLKAKEKVEYGHPKFKQLDIIIRKHFAENTDTRCIVFCEFRETVQLVKSLLLECGDPVKPQAFMGTNTVYSTSSPGVSKHTSLTQKQQLMVMNNFRKGECNVLVSTCIAEEGIDVGEVDLIVCFDTSSKNPMRLVQRIGRTGRQRMGKVIFLVTEGKEELSLKQCMADKNSLTNRIKNSKVIKQVLQKIDAPRMVPKNLQPRCVKLFLAPPRDANLAVVDPKPEKNSESEENVKSTKATKTKKAAKDKNQQDLRDLFSKQIKKNSLKKDTPIKAPPDITPKKDEVRRSSRLSKQKSGDLRRYIQVSPRKIIQEKDHKTSDVSSQDLNIFQVPKKIMNVEMSQKMAEENYSILKGEEIPSPLLNFMTRINSENIKTLLKGDCQFCENIMKCDDVIHHHDDAEVGKLDFLKVKFVKPSLDWIKDLKKLKSEDKTSHEAIKIKNNKSFNEIFDKICDKDNKLASKEIKSNWRPSEKNKSCSEKSSDKKMRIKDNSPALKKISSNSNNPVKDKKKKSVSNEIFSLLSYFKLNNIEDMFYCDSKMNIVDEGVSNKAQQTFVKAPDSNQTSPIFQNITRNKLKNFKSIISDKHSTPKLEKEVVQIAPKRKKSLVIWDEESLFGDLSTAASTKTQNQTGSLVSITQIIDAINTPKTNANLCSEKSINTSDTNSLNEPSCSRKLNIITDNKDFNKSKDLISSNKSTENLDESIIPATQFCESPKVTKKGKLNLGRLKSLRIDDACTKFTDEKRNSSPYFERNKNCTKIMDSPKIQLAQSTNKEADYENKCDLNKSVDSDATFVDFDDVGIMEDIKSLIEDVDFDCDMDESRISSSEKVPKSSFGGLAAFKYSPKRIQFPDSDDDIFENLGEHSRTEMRCSNRVRKKPIERKKKKRASNVSQFLDCEAAGSGDEFDHFEDSCDEDDMKSFIDFQNHEEEEEEEDHTDMTAKYLQSVRSPLKVQGFKVPQAVAARRRNINVFSQIPEPDDTTYGEDSFVVYDEPTEYDHDLSELEILEKKLKRSKKNSKMKRKRLKSSSDDGSVIISDDELKVKSDEDSFVTKKTNKKVIKRSRKLANVISSSSDSDECT